MSSAAASKEFGHSTATGTPPQPRNGRSGLSAKMIGGIGATLTLVTVAAVFSSQQPSPGSTAPAAPVYATVTPAPPPADIATAPVPVVSAPPAPLVFAPDPPSPPVYAAPAPAYVPAAPAQKQCSLPQRKFYVSGNGTIRVHDGMYVSDPVVLDLTPQEVTFPLARPASGLSEDETITVEGSASTVLMTTDYPGFRQVFHRLRGATSFVVHWVSLRNC
jgi:hypothetical protein